MLQAPRAVAFSHGRFVEHDEALTSSHDFMTNQSTSFFVPVYEVL